MGRAGGERRLTLRVFALLVLPVSQSVRKVRRVLEDRAAPDARVVIRFALAARPEPAADSVQESAVARLQADRAAAIFRVIGHGCI